MKTIALIVVTILALGLPHAVNGSGAESPNSIPRWFCEVLRIC